MHVTNALARLGAITLGLVASLDVASAQLGQWDVIGDSAVVCIHTLQLPNGKLLCIERPREKPFSFNPYSNGRTVSEITLEGESVEGSTPSVSSSFSIQAPDIYANAFCGGHAQMGNGSLLVVGGDPRSLIQAPNGTILINEGLPPELANLPAFLVDGGRAMRVFTPCAVGDTACKGGTWSQAADMPLPRWYPTVTTLKDGSSIIISGSLHNIDFDHLADNNNPTYEYYPPRGAPRPLDILTWAYPHSLYPLAFTMPSGKAWLFVSNKTAIIDPEKDANGSDYVQPSSGGVPDLDERVVPDHSPWIYPHTPAAVVLPMTIKNNWSFKIQLCGGSLSPNSAVAKAQNVGDVGDAAFPRTPASDACVQINPDDAAPKWTKVDNLPTARLMPDNVLLPDGTILYMNGAGWGQSGGNAGQVQYAYPPVMSVDLFDPEAPAGSQWKTLANMTVPRLYHSGALLLPSGHVITTGSEMNNYKDYWPTPNPNCWPAAYTPCADPFERRIERFIPPYLQTGKPRPEIASVPKSVTYGSMFKISMNTDATKIKRVNALRYATTTHGVNTDQRLVELEIHGVSSTALYVKAPPNGGIAPPGNWMIFPLQDGVPAVAHTVMFANGPVNDVVIPDGVTPVVKGEQSLSGGAGTKASNFFIAAIAGVAAFIGGVFV
ncbi:hypothetical protein HK104_008998 [Borealophlyctis nickersoniae]|nr:hypothetical protein HK104_008998 [Borealophlyctis nickersoniae]